MQDYIREVAAHHGLEVFGDAARNLVVRRPGHGGTAAAPVVLQTHLDMVCEKNSGTRHDWTKDPIIAAERDGWLVADNTTLGADNGIGVALSLALLAQPPSFVAPPLEALFTVEEETGLDGARGLDSSLLRGRKMLNFDSEEWGILYIGCAGGGDAFISLPVESAPLLGPARPYRLVLKGLRGGHSGADIHEDRGNAVLLLARAVGRLQDDVPGLRLLHIEGGNLDNAIPRESFATVGGDPSSLPRVRAVVAAIEADLKREFGRIDPDLVLELIAEPEPDVHAAAYLSEDSAHRLLDLLLVLPNGVLKMSHEVPGLVETSNNVARVRRSSPGIVEVLCLARSSIGSALEHTHELIARAARRCGAQVSRGATFSGWAPNRSQALLATTERVFEEVTGSRPNVTAIHAGLECGIIGDKLAGVEMVSFGPDIVGAHAPGERVRLESVDKLVNVVQQLMADLAGSLLHGDPGASAEL